MSLSYCSDVWIIRVSKIMRRVSVNSIFFDVFESLGISPDLCDNDRGGIVKFERGRYGAYQNDNPCLIKSRPGRPPRAHKELWHEISLGFVSNQMLVGQRPLLFASRFEAANQWTERAVRLILSAVADCSFYGYRVTLPIEMHPVAYAVRLHGRALFECSGGVETFEAVGDQNEALFSKPRNIYSEMFLTKAALDVEVFRKFLQVHRQFGGEQIDQGTHYVLRMDASQLAAARVSMWEAGVILSKYPTANEWLSKHVLQ